MITTGKFDCDGKEIFAGDKIIRTRGSIINKGEEKIIYQIHTITIQKAYLMGDGNMHDDGDGLIFCIGNLYNFWDGKEVRKLTNDEIKNINIKDGTPFHIENNKIVKFRGLGG